MSKLFVFGCSFSAVYEPRVLLNKDIVKYHEFRNGNFPPTWSELLSNDLNTELINKAIWGADNYTIFEEFCKEVENIEEDDVVIIGWSGINRFRLYSEILDKLLNVNIWTTSNNGDFKDISQQTIEEILVNRDNKKWVEEVQNWMLVINKLADLIGFKLIYWSFFKDIPEISILDELIELGADYITEETDGLINNDHFSENGHRVQYEYFKEIMVQYNKKN